MHQLERSPLVTTVSALGKFKTFSIGTDDDQLREQSTASPSCLQAPTIFFIGFRFLGLCEFTDFY
jgi:hypothetical protein